MSSDLVAAVLGTGSIGMRHLDVLKSLRSLDVLAVPIRPERCIELAATGYRTCDSLEAAADLGATLTIVATDTGRHCRDCCEAVRCGMDVLVEKPLGVDVEEGQRVSRDAVGAGRLVFVACTLRFSKSLEVFRKWLEQVGGVHSVRIECQSFLPEWRPGRDYHSSYSAVATEGGVLRDLIHEIDYAGWVFGWPMAVQANLRNLHRLGIASEETATLLWQIDAGPSVAIELDYLSRPGRRRLRAHGSAGTVEWDGITGQVTMQSTDDTARVFSSHQSRDEMVLAQDRAFINAHLGERDARLVTTEEGVRALAVCDAARAASSARREVAVVYL